ncbi:MAG TPA: hypothetical protein VIW80_18150 [Pyrinomonadaceae bacterium]|jgi:hypothetical protein
MSDEIGTYSFMPWLRQGVANQITSADGATSVKIRATIHIDLNVNAKQLDNTELNLPYPKDVPIYGPGDIVGIEQRAVIKTEPRNWITNFEPNYLPYIDFYDEDFPWRYTPAAPDSSKARLRPWITLVVLKETEFKEATNIKDRPLPFIEVLDASTTFPNADELWAWAHVHVNRNLVGSADDPRTSNMGAVIPAFEGVLNENADLAYSRIICPRQLDPVTAYHAFLIPTFESGRLAGLGLDPNDTPEEVHATFSAWGGYTGRNEPTFYPYYYRWRFRTGDEGDFEFLVRLLKPMPANEKVGRRDIDVQEPGSNITGILDPDLGGVLRLGGALQVPFDTLSDEAKAVILMYENWDQNPYPHPFQQDLSKFINLADDYEEKTAIDANHDSGLHPAISSDLDPVITPPLYGRWHALTRRLLTDRDGSSLPNNHNWVHELNLDPRWRVAAGFGTKVIQDNQESYMDAAWDQVGAVLEANRLLRQAQLAEHVSLAWYDRTVKTLAAQGDDRFFVFTAPVKSRAILNGVTAHHHFTLSPIPHALTSAPVRRMLRPRARLMQYTTFDGVATATNLLNRVNNQEVLPAPPKTVPPDLATVDKVADSTKPDNVPQWLWELLRRNPWLRFLPFVLAVIILLLALLLALLFGSMILAAGVLIAIVLVVIGLRLLSLAKQVDGADTIRSDNLGPAVVDALPASPDFTVIDVRNAGSVNLNVSTRGTDGEESTRFKQGLRDAYDTIQVSRQAGVVPDPIPVALPAVANAIVTAINPQFTITRFAYEIVKIPPRIAPLPPERIVPAMAYPELDIPMYKPLSALSSEYLVPNLNLVVENSITLLETNQRFIEAYMVGLNHEFARELLWREYPTDQRGSYFRQFWEVKPQLNVPTTDPEALRESLKDIPPIHTWRRTSNLGDHDNREAARENEEELVLVIRGELLKKYPNAVIYAQRAKWQRKANGSIDNTKERRLEDQPTVEANTKTPLYEARVDPDIFFFGFDLTASEARGGIGDDPTDDPGWFFIIQERPGEPRFGFDIERDGDLNVWNDLAWPDVLTGTDQFIRLNESTVTRNLVEPTSPEVQEKVEQWEEDKFLSWNKDIDAATAAYIMFQAPVMVAVHAAEMLPPAES